MRIHSLLLDIDGTLLVDSSAHLDSFFYVFNEIADSQLAIQMEGETPKLQGISVAGATDLGLFELACSEVGIAVTAASTATFFAHYAEHFRRTISLAHQVAGRPVNGLLPFMDKTRADAINCWVSSGNAKEISSAKLAAANILDYFCKSQTTGFGDQFRSRTELVADLVKTLCRQGTPKKEIALVGDTEADMRAASENGILAIGVTTGSADAEALSAAGAQVVVADLFELSKGF